jgi:hypothetical protein
MDNIIVVVEDDILHSSHIIKVLAMFLKLDMRKLMMLQ